MGEGARAVGERGSARGGAGGERERGTSDGSGSALEECGERGGRVEHATLAGCCVRVVVALVAVTVVVVVVVALDWWWAQNRTHRHKATCWWRSGRLGMDLTAEGLGFLAVQVLLMPVAGRVLVVVWHGDGLPRAEHDGRKSGRRRHTKGKRARLFSQTRSLKSQKCSVNRRNPRIGVQAPTTRASRRRLFTCLKRSDWNHRGGPPAWPPRLPRHSSARPCPPRCPPACRQAGDSFCAPGAPRQRRPLR